MRRILAVALVLSGLAAGQGVKIPTYKESKYPTLGQVKIPEPVQTTLSNGMRLFLLENHELPLVSGSVILVALLVILAAGLTQTAALT